MASRERDINKLFTTKYLIQTAALALTLGGATAAVAGGSETYQELKENNQTIGAIQHSLEESSNRPAPQKLQSAKDFIKSIEDELNAKSDETSEVHEVSSSLVSKASEIVVADQVLSREVAFQDQKKAAIEAFGANDLDEANIWTLVAGSTVAVASVGVLGGTLAHKTKPKSAHIPSEE